MGESGCERVSVRKCVYDSESERVWARVSVEETSVRKGKCKRK